VIYCCINSMPTLTLMLLRFYVCRECLQLMISDNFPKQSEMSIVFVERLALSRQVIVVNFCTPVFFLLCCAQKTIPFSRQHYAMSVMLPFDCAVTLKV